MRSIYAQDAAALHRGADGARNTDRGWTVHPLVCVSHSMEHLRLRSRSRIA